MKRSIALWFLLFWLVFLALGGLYGGITMLIDPTGGMLQVSEILPQLPVSNFVLPGLFLLVVMGVWPLFLAYALFAQPNWQWVDSLNWRGYHWAWAGTMVLCVVLALWLLVEGVLIGFLWPIQYVTAVNGLLILLFALLPRVRAYYQM